MNAQHLLRTLDTRYGTTALFVNDTGALSQSLQVYGEWAQNELTFIRTLIPIGSTVVDAGAYIGTHTLAFAQFTGPDGKVIAIEPQDQSFSLLKKNVASNRLTNVRVEHAAAADYLGVLYGSPIDITEKHSFGSASLSRSEVAARGVLDQSQQREKRISVNVLTIDSLNLSDCALIKIDVEGLEDLVIIGAERTITQFSPAIYAECNSVANGIRTFEIMRKFGYDIYLHVVDAFNKENFNGVEKNVFGPAREASLVGVTGAQSVNIQQMPPRQCELILKIESADDLVLGMLNKPQYAGEILETGAAARTGGDVWIKASRFLRDARDQASEVAHLARQEAEAVRAEREVLVRELDHAHLETEALRAQVEAAVHDRDYALGKAEVSRSEKDLAISELVRANVVAESIRVEKEVAERVREQAHLETDALRVERESLVRERDHARREAEVSHAEREIAERERVRANTGADALRAEKEIAERERDRARHDAEVSRAEKEIAVGTRDHAHLEADATRAEKEIAERERDLARQETEAIRKQMGIVFRERDQARREAEISRAEREIADRERDRALLDGETSRKEKGMAMRERERALLEAEATRAEKEAAARESECRQIEAAAANAQFNAAMLQARSARKEADEAQSRHSELARRCNDLQVSMEQSMAELNHARSEIHDLKRALDEMQSSLSWRITRLLRTANPAVPK